MIRALPSELQIPPWTLAVTAMLSVQLGSALSVGLIDQVGPAGTAWLRLTMGALMFIAIARPSLRGLSRDDLLTLTILGIMTGVMTIAFLAAIDRIPLGTAVAIEFLGPLTVAAIHAHSKRALVWPVVALAGVTMLTQPWQGDVNLGGMLFAILAGTGWGTYILLTQRIGERFSGVSSLSITIAIAAITTAIIGVPQAHGHITPTVISAAIGLAVLLPLLPFSLEMLALRRMNANAFGTLMSVEPAIAMCIGLAVLHQQPTLLQIGGIALVVTAGAGSQR